MKSAGPTTSPTVIHKPVALQEVDRYIDITTPAMSEGSSGRLWKITS